MKTFVVALGVSFFLLGCQKIENKNPFSLENRIIGEWYTVDSFETAAFGKWAFLKNGDLVRTDFRQNRIDSFTSWSLYNNVLQTSQPLMCFPLYYKIRKAGKNKYALYFGLFDYENITSDDFYCFLTKEKPIGDK